MNIFKLHEKLAQLIIKGQGNKPIYTEDGDETLEIDSVQKDTMPAVEANYYFIMAGGRVSKIV